MLYVVAPIPYKFLATVKINIIKPHNVMLASGERREILENPSWYFRGRGEFPTTPKLFIPALFNHFFDVKEQDSMEIFSFSQSIPYEIQKKKKKSDFCCTFLNNIFQRRHFTRWFKLFEHREECEYLICFAPPPWTSSKTNQLLFKYIYIRFFFTIDWDVST